MSLNTQLVTWNAQALAAGSAVGSNVVDLDGFSALSLVLSITTTSGGTAPTIQVNLQASADGANWSALPAAFWQGGALPAALALANGASQYNFPAVGLTLALPLVRAVYTVVSTPTVTGAIYLVAR